MEPGPLSSVGVGGGQGEEKAGVGVARSSGLPRLLGYLCLCSHGAPHMSCLPGISHCRSPRWGQGWGWGLAGPAQQMAKGHHFVPVTQDGALGL